MRIFVAGIMQGSHLAATIHHQGYRDAIKQLLARHFAGAEIYDPLADHADSLSYDDEKGRAVFLHHCRLCREVDVLVAFVPEASMGTAIEMWEAYQHGTAVIAVSPMRHNWAVKFLSHALVADLEELEAQLTRGDLVERIGQIVRAKRS
jgi:hypothetical protein